ncbi:DUF2169 domain-containing protein [Variovorax sp. PAMC 28711]|uniref:DUF2169 domain-containing protein n=1 Tax=Variovorax sp. PAMC 28711 TaxID=1795631 RepID=UPI00078EB932|nr:DUF2169 domain-containing protein [Variovorax sp. PAMC 28711]AMM25109.1 hypothetical protein AX767_12595 [Variovorax sp. PAMC 28711]
MKLTNNTPFPSVLEMGSTTDNEQLGTVACKVSYQWADDGEIFPVPDAALWPVARAPELYGDVLLLPDADHRREGVDVLVFGDAVAPRGQAVQQMRVGVASGGFVRQFDVLGDRRWARAHAEAPWQLSAPTAFERMPLGCERAFGGSAAFGDGDHPFSMNPRGRGYALDPAELGNVALPNVERIDQRMARWSDQPVPACFHKPPGGLLLPASGPESWNEAASGDDPMRLSQVLLKHSFQQAPPDFVCPRGALGPRLTLKGFDTGGLQHIALPPEIGSARQGAVVYVEVGSLRSAFPLRISAILVLVAQRMLVVTFAASFRYLMRAEEARRALLQWHGDHAFALEPNP